VIIHKDTADVLSKIPSPLVFMLDSLQFCVNEYLTFWCTCRGELNTLKAELSRAKEDSDAMAKQVGQPVQMK
jgi:hypothetical protein